MMIRDSGLLFGHLVYMLQLLDKSSSSDIKSVHTHTHKYSGCVHVCACFNCLRMDVVPTIPTAI